MLWICQLLLWGCWWVESSWNGWVLPWRPSQASLCLCWPPPHCSVSHCSSWVVRHIMSQRSITSHLESKGKCEMSDLKWFELFQGCWHHLPQRLHLSHPCWRALQHPAAYWGFGLLVKHFCLISRRTCSASRAAAQTSWKTSVFLQTANILPMISGEPEGRQQEKIWKPWAPCPTLGCWASVV